MPAGIPCRWNDTYYESITEAYEAIKNDIDISYHTFRRWVVDYHWTCDEDSLPVGECEWCGEIFIKKHERKRFCSKNCGNKAGHERRRVRTMMRRQARRKVDVGICVKCNQQPKAIRPSGYVSSYCYDCESENARERRLKADTDE